MKCIKYLIVATLLTGCKSSDQTTPPTPTHTHVEISTTNNTHEFLKMYMLNHLGRY
jgi:hypothetical protein